MNKLKMIKKKINDTLEKYSPPGRNLKRDMLIYRLGLWVAIGYSSIFTVEYRFNWYELHTYGGNGRLEVIEGAKMMPFREMLSGYLNAFYILAILMLVAIALNYLHHRKESKSFYLMKRLPDRWEYHKRCITLPLVGMILALIMAGMMTLIWYGFYMHFTPAQCLPL